MQVCISNITSDTFLYVTRMSSKRSEIFVSSTTSAMLDEEGNR